MKIFLIVYLNQTINQKMSTSEPGKLIDPEKHVLIRKNYFENIKAGLNDLQNEKVTDPEAFISKFSFRSDDSLRSKVVDLKRKVLSMATPVKGGGTVSNRKSRRSFAKSRKIIRK
jgi:hypothetical protein